MNSFVLAPIGELHLPPDAHPTKGALMRQTSRLAKAGVVVEGGIVSFVGSAAGAISHAPRLDRIDLGKFLVTPGLIDCHTHLSWAGNRADEFVRRSLGETYEQIAAAGGGILASARAMEAIAIEELTASIVARCDLLADLGTTTIESKCSYGLTPEASLKELRAIQDAAAQADQTVVTTYMGAHAIPSGETREQFIKTLLETMIPAASKTSRFNDVFCEEGAFDVEESRTILEAGIRHGMRPKIHSDEFNALGGTEMAVSLGAVSCDHLLQVTESGIRALASGNSVAVTLPGTALYLDKQYADARRLIDSGCAVALGSDFNPGSCQIPSMAFAMGLAVSKMGMTPEEALTAATVNAAAAIDEPSGTLSIGERADICVWPCSHLEEMIYEFAFIRPQMVFVAGERVV